MLKARQLLVVQAGQGQRGVVRKESFHSLAQGMTTVCPGNDELLGLLGVKFREQVEGVKSQSQGLKGQSFVGRVQDTRQRAEDEVGSVGKVRPEHFREGLLKS